MPVPPGGIGELYVGGPGLARGYVNDVTPSFVVNPFNGSERLYKTGDIVRWLPEGDLEYLGRNDALIKINGHRIDLKEIEIDLSSFSGVQHAVVIVEKGLFLVAYYAAQHPLDEETIMGYLKEKLPEYAVPNQLIYLKKIPLNVNGKLDKSALPKPDTTHFYIAPQNEFETGVCEIFGPILNLSKISVQDDFFSLGGRSLGVIQLVNKINTQFNCQILIADVYKERTVQNLARLIKYKKNTFLYKPYLITSTDIPHRHEPFALTNIQQAYYVGRFGQFALGNISTHFYSEYVFTELNIDALESALNKMIERHPSLRTIFKNGQQMFVKDYLPYRVQSHDVSSPEDYDAIRQSYVNKLYDVETLWLFDVAVSRYQGEITLHISVDALIMDATSLHTFFVELTKLYHDKDYALPALGITFRDYVVKYQQVRASPLFDDAKRYWRDRLKDYNFSLNLPILPHEKETTPTFQRISTEIEGVIWSKIKTKACQYGISETILVLCAYGYMLKRWSNQKNLCVNLTLFNRLPFHSDTNAIMGDLTTTLLFNYDHQKNETLLNSFRETQRLFLQDLEHGVFDGLDFQRLARENMPSLANEKILAPVVLTSLLGMDYCPRGLLDDSFKGTQYSMTQTSQVWLDLKTYERGKNLVIEFDYVKELFSPHIIASMHEHLLLLLRCLAEVDWDKEMWPALPLPVLDQSIITQSNSATQEPKFNTLCYAYEEQRSKAPEKIAVIDDAHQKTYTYEDISSASNTLAKYIISKGHTVPEKNPEMRLMGVLSQKGCHQLISTLAIMKAGFGYLPLKIDWPIARMKEIIQQGEVTVLLISQEQYDRPDIQKKLLESGIHYIIIDPFLENKIQQETISITLPKIFPEQVAYVIFTSGSTGKPKGVTITHFGAWNTIQAINAHFAIGPDDKALALSDLSFDLSVYDLFGVLPQGGAIVFPDQTKIKEPRYWHELVEKHQISLWNSVPQIACLFIESACRDARQPTSLRVFLLSGDWIPVQLPTNIKKYCEKAQITSLGGATEGSIWSIWYHNIDRLGSALPSIPYGVAMPNQKMYILNDDGEHCPVGVSGQIYIGGDGVAVNYYGNPEKTQQHFIEHSVLGRLYRTGDLGCWNEEGYMVFMGRYDNQVKIDGYLIELGEISARLQQVDGVGEALTLLVHQDNQHYLVSYYTGNVFDETTARAYLEKFLPYYMLPTMFVHIDAFPLSANGKVEPHLLKVPKIIHSSKHYKEPASLPENMLCSAFSEVLRIDRVSVDDSFFTLGGTSLMAIALVSSLQATFDIKVSDIFNLKTPEAIASKVTFGKNFLVERLNNILALYENEARTTPYRQLASNFLPRVRIEPKQHQQVLLTGATGFLGCNILYQLLTTTEHSLVLLVRGSSNEAARSRVSEQLQFYFHQSLEDLGADRVVVYSADIENKQLGLSEAVYQELISHVDSVIHCAALVKHYGDYDIFYSANVKATQYLLEFCEKTAEKDFHYISTNAVNKTSTNVYVTTKRLAEKSVIAYQREKGIKGHIYRVGNLALMSHDAMVQKNIEDNAFSHWIQCLLLIKCIAPEISKVEITPADCAARAIVTLFDKQIKDQIVFQVFNPLGFDVKQSLSLRISTISIHDFIDKLKQYSTKPEFQTPITRLLLYLGWLGEEPFHRTLSEDNGELSETCEILKQLGFEWQAIAPEYFSKYVENITHTPDGEAEQSDHAIERALNT